MRRTDKMLANSKNLYDYCNQNSEYANLNKMTRKAAHRLAKTQKEQAKGLERRYSKFLERQTED